MPKTTTSYKAVFAGESSDSATVNVYIPELRATIQNVNVSRPAGMDYKYSSFTTFTVELSDEAKAHVEKSDNKVIDGRPYQVSGQEAKIPTKQIIRSPKKPLVYSFEGMGDLFMEKFTKCVSDLKGYMDDVTKQTKDLFGSSKAKRQSKNAPQEGEMRMAPPHTDAQGTPGADSTKMPSMQMGPNGTDMEAAAGKGMLMDGRGNSMQGKRKDSDASNASPMGILGVDGMDLEAKDIMPKGNVLTPHVNKRPDIMAMISLGVGIINVVNTIRILYGYEEKWKETDEGLTKQADTLGDEIQDFLDRTTPPPAPAGAGGTDTDRIVAKIDKVKKIMEGDINVDDIKKEIKNELARWKKKK